MAEEEPSSEEQLSALVLDDNELVRSMIRDALRHFGFAALEAKNGAEAIEIGRRAPNLIQILIADLRMAGMDVQTTASLLKILQPGVKVLCLSRHAEVALSEYGFNECNAFLQKPFGAKELRHAIQTVLDS